MKASTFSLHTTRRLLHALLCGLLLATWAGHAEAIVFTMGPVSDNSCQYHTLQDAVTAARVAAGSDIVQISAGTYTGQATVSVTDSSDLIIEGGYASCGSGSRTGTSTLEGLSSATGPLISDGGGGGLTLLHLILQNNGAGGVTAVAAGPLTLSDVALYSNHSNYGGGLFVSGNAVVRQSVHLLDVQFNSNTATANGGGIYATTADIVIDGNAGSYFLGNIAQGQTTGTGDGGGIYALDTNIRAVTHTPSTAALFGNNTAQRYGGGVSYNIASGGAYEFILCNDRVNQPLEFAYNAAQLGGAIYMKSYSPTSQILSYGSVCNAIFDHNEANDGAVAYLDSNGQSPQVFTGLILWQSNPGDDPPPCAPGLVCNSVHDNLAHAGSIVTADASGPAGGASFEFRRGSMRDNSTVNGALIFGGTAGVSINGSLFADNTIGGDLVTVINQDLHFANSTVAQNTIASSQLFSVILAPASLELLHSLLVQANDPLQAYSLGGGITATVHDIGANGITGLPDNVPGNNIQYLTDPFVNAAQGNFHIRTTSSAVDRWVPNGDPDDPPPTLDLDGALRPYTTHGSSTPYDFGAYEAGSVVDVIFRNGFELP